MYDLRTDLPTHTLIPVCMNGIVWRGAQRVCARSHVVILRVLGFPSLSPFLVAPAFMMRGVNIIVRAPWG